MEGLERIKQISKDIEDKALLEIINYLLSRKDMNEKYINEEKSLKQMVEYIKGEAKKQEKNGMAIIKDDEVFGWAIHYFDESNEKLGLKEEKKITTPIENQQKPAETSKEPAKTESIIQYKNSSSKKEYISEGQLTLF